MGKIFLSYVRADSEADTGRLEDTLKRELPADTKLFIDVRDIEYGSNWKRTIERAIEDSVIMLCAMGPEWKLSSAVEFELDLAFKSDVSVVPVLFRRANLDTLTESLQPAIAELRDRNAISIEHNSWDRDIAPLIDLLKRILADPSHARVIINPPDPKQLLGITPSSSDGKWLLSYAQDLAECLDDDEVFDKAKEASVNFEAQLKYKREYDLEMSKAGFHYRNIRGDEPILTQIVQAARKRLEIEQNIRQLLETSSGRDAYPYQKIALYLDDETLLSKLTELYQEYRDAIQEYKEGGTPYRHPGEVAKELDETLAAAKKRLGAELPGITKRYPDRKWP